MNVSKIKSDEQNTACPSYHFISLEGACKVYNQQHNNANYVMY
jgi:hypothetical protein